MKRLLIITFIILATLGIGIGAYYFFTPKPQETATDAEGSPFPVAGGVAPGTGGGEEGVESTQTSNNNPSALSSRLTKITAGPVALGHIALDIASTTASSTPDTTVSFIEKRSGNVYTYLVGEKKLTRTANKTVPGIMTAFWFPNGKTALVRYLSGANFSIINTYALQADGSEGFYLPQDLSDITVSSTSILMLASGPYGSTASLARTDGSSAIPLFSSPLASLRVSFAGKNQYLAFTKPTASLQGNAYLVNASGNLTRIAGPEKGLVALSSPTGKWVLVSYVANGNMTMKLVNTLTNEAIALPIATIADKCAWAQNEATIYCGIPQNALPDRNYPDDWYKGTISFSDRIWKIQVADRYAQLVLDFAAEAKTTLDAESLSVSPSGKVLVFTNKNDESLWSYQL